MEFDELKSNWNKLQQDQKQISGNTINKIIMNTANTINEMQQKNQYWNKFAKIICPVLIVVLIINVIIGYFAPNHHRSLLTSITYALIMILFAVITLYMYRWQETILNTYNPGNLKESLRKTVQDFKRFYLVFTLSYMVLYPAYFYAAFKLLFIEFNLSQQTILMACGLLSVISIIGGHIYYKLTYFKRLKLLEADLKELMGS